MTSTENKCDVIEFFYAKLASNLGLTVEWKTCRTVLMQKKAKLIFTFILIMLPFSDNGLKWPFIINLLDRSISVLDTSFPLNLLINKQKFTYYLLYSINNSFDIFPTRHVWCLTRGAP